MNTAVYMITYDLNEPGQDYDGVISAIKESSSGKWCSYWKSSYLIQSNLTANEIISKIQPHLTHNDKLIVIQVTSHYQGWLGKEQWDYISQMF